MSAVAAEGLKDDLTRYLYGQLPPDAGRLQWDGIPGRWVMSQEWFDTVCEAFLTDVRTPSAPVYLLGFPVTVEPDGGVPHVVLPARAVQ